MKKDMQSRFSGLTRKINLSYLLYEKPIFQNLLLALESIS